MYLSKISFLPSAQTAIELARLSRNGAYATHQLLWNVFTTDTKRTFLYREEQGRGGMPHYFVLSQSLPESDMEFFNIQYKEFRPNLVKGQRLAFKLRSNPTICLKDNSGRSKRHDVLMHAKHQARNKKISSKAEVRTLMEQAALHWICDENRLSKWGVSLDITPEIERYTQHRSRKKLGHNVQFSSVDYQGLLTVIDPGIFLENHAQGFGRAKALGCGLMLIRPI